jgi:hypothetical protein
VLDFVTDRLQVFSPEGKRLCTTRVLALATASG